MSNREHVRELLLKMVQVIVEHPKAVSIQTDYEDETIIFVVTVDRRDAGRWGLSGGRIAISAHHRERHGHEASEDNAGRNRQTAAKLDFTNCFLGLMRGFPTPRPSWA